MTLPPPLSWLWNGWMAFSKILGRVMSAIILTILWFVGFGMYAMILKIGSLFKQKETLSTYWIDAFPDQDLKRQF
jgi:hypothetical protein